MHRITIKNISSSKFTSTTHTTSRYLFHLSQISFTTSSSNTPTLPNIKSISIKNRNSNLHLSSSNKLKKYQSMLPILAKISINSSSSPYFIIKHPSIRNYGNLIIVAIISKVLSSIIKILSSKPRHKEVCLSKILKVFLLIPPKLK